MSPEIRPSTRVLVRWAGLPDTSPCHRHRHAEPCLFQHVCLVDRIDERYGEHCHVVVFPTLTVPPFGSPWVDSFKADELVVVE
jgi:hypothetical protein